MPEKEKKYGLVPTLDRDTMLTGFDWAVWSALATFGQWDTTDGNPVMKIGTCYPSLPKLARRAHISVRSVQRVLRRLEALGYIGVDARHDEKNGGQTSNYYYLCPVPLVSDTTFDMFPESGKEKHNDE